jgi:FixJ family two-component response regulator
VAHESSRLIPANRTDPPLVVVVDDDASFRLWGFRTWTFASAEEYLRLGVPTDCLVLDLHLEGMSGLELQYLLASRGNTTPIIFISAMDDPIARKKAFNGGAVAFLEKPFDDYRLQEVLQNVTAFRVD